MIGEKKVHICVALVLKTHTETKEANGTRHECHGYSAGIDGITVEDFQNQEVLLAFLAPLLEDLRKQAGL